MDPLTQAVLGGAIGQAAFRRQFGVHATLAGAAIAALPDLDILYHVDQWSEWAYHRSITHSLLALPLAGWAIGEVFWRLERRRRKVKPSEDAGQRRRAWIGLCVLALLSHPLLDLFTSYGTQLLAPLSERRFALDAVAVIDPAYTLPLLAAVAIGLRPAGSRWLARGAAVTALVVSNLYLAGTWWLNAEARSMAERQLAANGITVTEVASYPTIFQPFLRRIVVRTPTDIRVGFLTLLAPGPIRWQCYAPPKHPLIARLRAMPEGRLLEWFAMGQTVYHVEDTPAGTRVEGSDLRYGPPAAGVSGMWGIEATFDEQGELHAPPSRFGRSPPLSLENLARLWRWTLGTTMPNGGSAHALGFCNDSRG